MSIVYTVLYTLSACVQSSLSKQGALLCSQGSRLFYVSLDPPLLVYARVVDRVTVEISDLLDAFFFIREVVVVF